MVFLAGCGLLSVFAAGVIASRLSDGSVERVATILPWFLLGMVAVHFGAVIAAWRLVRRLKAVAPEKRRTNLLSALLMPPQAMRLRALLGDGFFPPQHPLAVIVAWGAERAKAAWAFNAIADLRLLPDEVRSRVDLAAQFGGAAVITRRDATIKGCD